MKYKNNDLLFVNNISEPNMVADMLLFGMISGSSGEGLVNGDDFAKEMVFLSEIGFKTIRLNINSVGGGIIKGMSIINAMNIVRKNGTSIETHIVGVADSMAGMVSAFGDRGKRTVANFGSGVVHEPLLMKEDGTMVTIDEMEEGEVKTEALNMRSSLIDLMASSTGNDKEFIKSQMKESKRLKAEEMLSFGMVDEIVKLSNEVVDIKNKTAVELMAACSKLEIKKQNPKKMKEVNKILNLSDDAAEGSAVKAIIALQNKVKNQSELLKTATEDKKTLETTVVDLQNKVKATEDEKAENYVDGLINSGKLKKENREQLVNQAKENFAVFKTLTDSLEVTFVDVTKEIKDVSVGEKKEALADEYHNLMVNGGLYDLEKSNPNRYAKLEEAYLNSSKNYDLK